MVQVRDYRAETREAARRVQAALTRCGFYHKQAQVRFRELVLEHAPEGRRAVLVVDVQRLPHRVSVPKLCAGDVVHHLQAVVGRPVGVRNTTGLEYVVYLDPPKKERLPTRVELDLDDAVTLHHKERDSIRFSIGEGAAEIEIDTGSGSIHITRAD